MGFFFNLESRSREINSLLCVGLDPHPEQLTENKPQAALNFCRQIIEATSDLALAYKPNSAFFEFYGSEGIQILENVIEIIPPEIPIILDVKRGDIASSAAAYAGAIFENLKVDAATINPYLGYDAIAPFLKDEMQAVFLLCKTSNPGSIDFQELELERAHLLPEGSTSLKLYELIAQKSVGWNEKDNLGLVVGATQIEPLRRVRQIAPELWFLAPGVGAQGGDLEQALAAGLREDGYGMVIPVSRGIAKSPDPRRAADDLNLEINNIRGNLNQHRQLFSVSTISEIERGQLAVDILDTGCVQFGEFTLKSGIKSPIYIDLRRLIGYPELLRRVGTAFSRIVSGLEFDHLAGLPYAGLPIASTISFIGQWSLVYPRKESKSYGTQVEVEGVFDPGQKVVLIDDLATTGGSKFEAIEKLTDAGLTVKEVVVFIDRESGASEDLSAAGFQMHAIYTLSQLLEIWFSANQISAQQLKQVEEFLREAG